MNTFVAALRSEVLPVIIIGSLLFTYCYLLITEKTTPEELKLIVQVVVAFYFGGKIAETSVRNGSAAANTAVVLSQAGRPNSGSAPNG